MELPEYVTVDEVKRVCRELNVRDWTTVKKAEVLPEEARVILNEVDVEGMNIDLDDFRRGPRGGTRTRHEI